MIFKKIKIGISQLDGKIPNLALMQITAFHEKKGHFVERYKGNLFAHEYDKIYFSKIFDFTETPLIPKNATIGGTGVDFFNRLPKEIEKCKPSYSLYPDCNYHLGFSMKGCRFSCSFCCVPKKEGRPKINSTIKDLLINPNGKDRLMLLDNDFFGGADWEQNLIDIIELKLRVCFVQGLNIRIITKEQARLLAKCKYRNSKFKQKYLTFAWDRFKDRRLIEKGIDFCVNAGIPTKEMQFFILIGYDTTEEEDYERVMKVAEWGAKPFVMPYDKNNAYQKRFARWVNHRAIFNKVSWEEYQEKTKKQIIENQILLEV